MATRTIESVFRPTPPQRAFLKSKAFIRAYGGAMGGGKSRAMCESVFDYCLDHPGLIALIARDAHTSIILSTRKTMLDQVIPQDGDIIVRSKQSGGEDYVELFNGSQIHFIGMDDPYRYYSSEIGIYALDEAQEIENHDAEKVVRLITRCRQRCDSCIRKGEKDCPHLPHKVMLSFNPSSPDSWLFKWFILGSRRTEYGYRTDGLVLPEADEPIGDAEFIFALPTDNPYLSDGYLKSLGGLPAHLKRRYLEGKWEFISGKNFFDPDALMFYEELARATEPIMQGSTTGNVHDDALYRQKLLRNRVDPIKVQVGRGPLQIWRRPHFEHRYVMAIDVSSGGSHDYSAIQVVDVDAFEQVAEWQGKSDPDEVAVEAYRVGRIFNDAIAVPEITGGWGFSVEQELRRLRYHPMYTRTVLDRITKKWTDRTGWDTTTKNRAHMLDTLERVLREREFGLYSMRAIGELASFVWTEKRDKSLGKPEARSGANDDLVVALAIAVTVAASRPPKIATQSRTKKYKHWLPLGDTRAAS